MVRVGWPSLGGLNQSLAQLVRSLPVPALIPLGLAIGCLFAVLGPVNDVMNGGTQALWLVALGSLAGAVIANSYAFGWMRQHVGLMAFAITINVLWTVLAGKIFSAHLPATQQMVTANLRRDGMMVIALMILSYVFFLAFLSGTATRYLKARAEIELAHRIHEVLVPAVDSRIASFEFFGRSAPSGEVGGDLIDVVDSEPGWFGYVADVSGHGVSSGLVMGMFKSALRMRLRQPGTLGELLTDVSAVLFPLKSSAMFVTVAGVRAGDEGTLEYTVAGHLPILRVRNGRVDEITTPQIPIGMFEQRTFVSATLDCAPGDLLALITDGLIEVFDASDRELGLDAVKTLLASSAERPLNEIADAIVAQARAHGKQIDDQTLLLIRRG